MSWPISSGGLDVGTAIAEALRLITRLSTFVIILTGFENRIRLVTILNDIVKEYYVSKAEDKRLR